MKNPSDVAIWRGAERRRLIEARLSIPARERKRMADRVATHLDQLIESSSDTIVSLYSPIRGELNLRRWMQQMCERGVRIALPVVVAKATPLIFREWTPRSTMIPGIWRIPIPIDGQILDPTVVISPLVGFDQENYRLGYGGGFFDRTLEAMYARGLSPHVIGVGYALSAISTIYPQPHDIPMSTILTERGIFQKR